MERMSSDEVKMQMMQLWKDTFHDSDNYINLIFNTYFNENLVEYVAYDNIIVAALLAIPYCFQYSSESCYIYNDNNGVSRNNYDNQIKSLYLCGLATKREYRSSGLMTQLINKINEKACKMGYGFTFLIPADDKLRNYYRNRDYVDVSYKYEYSCSNIFDMKSTTISNRLSVKCSDDYSIISVNGAEDVVNNFVNVSLIDKIHNYINSYKSIYRYVNIVRDRNDCITIIKENNISDGKIYVAFNSNNIIVGILIASIVNEESCNIQLLITDDDNISELLLTKLRIELGEKISIALYSIDDRRGGKCYRAGGAIAEGVNEKMVVSPDFDAKFRLRPFAMARISKLAEVLIFAAACAPDRKYSILVTEDGLTENCGFYEVADGRVFFTPLADLDDVEIASLKRRASPEAALYHLSVPEVASMLWSATSSEAAGGVGTLPHLPLNVSLMLE